MRSRNVSDIKPRCGLSRAKKFVEKPSDGQEVCGLCDKKFVEIERKSRRHGGICDRIYVAHQEFRLSNR